MSDDTSTPSYRVERGEPETGGDSAAEQSELSLGAMARGAIGAEGASRSEPGAVEGESGSPGAEADRREAESPDAEQR